MDKITDKQRLEDWKKALAKSGIKYDTDDEYEEALYNLTSYFETLIEMDIDSKNVAFKSMRETNHKYKDDKKTNNS